MRMSQLFVQTLRDAPADARTPGYQFLLRGGFLVPQDSGTGAPRSFLFLPLGARVREHVEAAVARTLDSIGGQLIAAPSVRPPDWPASASSPTARPLRFRDRGMREMLSDVSHEAALLRMAASVVRSYRQLPILLYEGWQFYRDDERMADGLLGAVEGRVVDAFGLYRDGSSAEAAYGELHIALNGLLAAWGLDAVDVILSEDSTSRATGHAVIFRADAGDVSFARCSACSYAAELSSVRLARPDLEAAGAPLPTEDVETPHCKTIADLATYLGIPAARTAKALFLSTYGAAQGERFVIAVVRGDTALDEDKLRAVLGLDTIAAATEAEIRGAGAEPGYGSPLGLTGVTVVVDTLVAETPNLVAGANRPGYHTVNVNCGRDFQPSLVADIATAQDGSPCPNCGSPLHLERGVALAELRELGSEPARAAGAAYLDEAGQNRPLTLTYCRLHVDRLLAAIAESHHDKSGLVWPAVVAPFDVHLVTLGKANAAVNAAAAHLVADLAAGGVSVLFDDRDERAGVKFNDADLIGIPLRVVVGDRGLQSGTVEVKHRSAAEAQQVKLDALVDYVRDVSLRG